MSIYMPNWGSIPGRCCAKWILAAVLVVSCEHSCFSICLSCHGRKAFECLKGKPALAKWDVVSGVKCFKKKSVLFPEVHPKMNFREAPHQIGPSLLSRAIACSPKRNPSWQYFVKTWQKPETTRRAFSDNKNGLAAVAMVAGKGDMSLFRDSDVGGTSSSRDCRNTFSRCWDGGVMNLNQYSLSALL